MHCPHGAACQKPSKHDKCDQHVHIHHEIIGLGDNGRSDNTVYLEIFCCKNIFVVAINHENFIHEIIFTRVNSYYSQNLFAMLASYFARWPSLDSYLQPWDGLLGNSEQTI